MIFRKNKHTVDDIKQAIENHVNGRTFSDNIFDIYANFNLEPFNFEFIINQTEYCEPISIQASKFHYSIPRDNVSEYTAVEIGFPPIKFRDEFISQYIENIHNGNIEIYPFVPIQALAEELHWYLNNFDEE